MYAIRSYYAQEKTITGVVKSDDGEPIPGVNVIIEGTIQGTATDFDGNYKLTVPSSSSVLVFSAIGFTTQSIVVGDKTTIDVVLASFLTAVDEVVVIGYGTQQKKEVTSSIVNVKSDEFNSYNFV